MEGNPRFFRGLVEPCSEIEKSKQDIVHQQTRHCRSKSSAQHGGGKHGFNQRLGKFTDRLSSLFMLGQYSLTELLSCMSDHEAHFLCIVLLDQPCSKVCNSRQHLLTLQTSAVYMSHSRALPHWIYAKPSIMACLHCCSWVWKDTSTMVFPVAR